MFKKTVAIILAGGTGARMKEKTPKQFLDLAGKPIIIHAIEKFDKNNMVSDLVVVCHASHIGELEKLIKESGISKAYRVVPGGKTRQESSFIGLKNCPDGTDVVLIHDAVRPFVDERMINDVVSAARGTGAAGPVIEVEDTVVVEEDGKIKEIPDRGSLKRIQTPQGFLYDVIKAAHERALAQGKKDYTDDCGMVLDTGKPVKTVKGLETNIKITAPMDMLVAEKYLSERSHA